MVEVIIDFESLTLSGFDTVLILSPNRFATGLASSLLDTSLFTTTLEGREVEDLVLLDSLVVAAMIFLGEVREEIFLRAEGLDVTVLDGSERLPEVLLARLKILLLIGDTSSVASVRCCELRVVWEVMEGL